MLPPRSTTPPGQRYLTSTTYPYGTWKPRIAPNIDYHYQYLGQRLAKEAYSNAGLGG